RAWTWPVDGPVLRPFVFDPAHPYAGGQHRGIDIGTAAGTRVRAPAAGTVSFAGSVPNGGETISIETPAGYTATLLHLGALAVKRGAKVAEGDVVAAAGPDAFVYLGLRVSAEPHGYVDPLAFLPPRAGPAADTDGAPAASAASPANATDGSTAQPSPSAAPAPSIPAPEAAAPEQPAQ